VPSAALDRGEGNARVWVIESGRVSSRVVDLGPPREDQVEVRSGLEGGESVVLNPPAGLKNGARVRVVGS
jgi:multidrug efflux pump subunit AcrA (membrane-fusion protein)